MKRMSMIVLSLLLVALLLGSAAWAETEAAEAVGVAEAESPSLVGIWTYTDEENGLSAVYDLKDDGTGTYTMIVGEEEVAYELKYEVQDNLLLVTYVNNETFTEDDVFENEFRFEDEQTLVIKDSFDEEMTFVKNQE